MSHTTAAALRDTGIDIVGEMPWGTHFTLFYETRHDLVDVIVPFLAAGLLADEYCVWMPINPHCEEEVRTALRDRVPDFDARVANQQVEFVQQEEWYRPDGEFRVDAVMQKLHEVYDGPSVERFSGFRGCGDLGWVEEKDHDTLMEYEHKLDAFGHGRRSMILCTYPMISAPLWTALDEAETHDFVVARRNAQWQRLETAEHYHAIREIERLNAELEQRVEQRTNELIAERKQSAAKLALARRRAREEALEARFAAILEERTRMAREIHDSLLQGVTGIALQLRAMLPHFNALNFGTDDSIRRIAELAETTARDARRTVWEMRPIALLEADLPTALRDSVRRVSAGHEVRVTVEGEARRLPHNVEDTVLRIAQESVTNAVKHSDADSVTVTLGYRPDVLTLTVVDSGQGFDVDSAFRAYAGRWGLLGMRERASRIGASLSIRSHKGGGTTVQLEVPVSDNSELVVSSG